MLMRCVCYFIKICEMLFIKVSRQVKLELQHSEHFHVIGPEDGGRKVAPGMSATFTVYFTPQENKVSETEEFDCFIQ